MSEIDHEYPSQESLEEARKHVYRLPNEEEEEGKEGRALVVLTMCVWMEDSTSEQVDSEVEVYQRALAKVIHNQRVDAAAAKRNQIIAALEQQMIPPPLVPRQEKYNAVLRDAITVISHL